MRPCEYGSWTRIIPACAGNTGVRSESRVLPPDHPRVCGEHSNATTAVHRGGGSSPRVRGTLIAGHGDGDVGRIIPACAGNTVVGVFGAQLRPDHPRVCGEHGATLPALRCSHGSSPRVRGTLRHQARAMDQMRIIPACAGNTAPGILPLASWTDHPRVCGEHQGRIGPACRNTGSSPRVRGTRRARPAGTRQTRIIPACAGNTLYGGRCSWGPADHPRVCGEHDWFPRPIVYMGGSSPRVRGTRPHNP